MLFRGAESSEYLMNIYAHNFTQNLVQRKRINTKQILMILWWQMEQLNSDVLDQ